MSPLTSLIARRIIALVVAAAAFNFISDRAHASGLETCPAKAGELASSPFASVWIEHGTLMSCSTVGGRDPQIRQLGRWASQGHLSLVDTTVGWTQRKGGVDKVYAADLASTAKDPRFLKGARPTSGASKGKHGIVVGLVAQSRSVAWVTKSRVLSVALPQRRVELGLAAGKRSAAATLAGLQITETGSEGDVCSAVGHFSVTAPVSGPNADVTIDSSYATGVAGC